MRRHFGGDEAETMRLDPELVARVAHRTEQWARALERAAYGDDRVAGPEERASTEAKLREAASLFAIAGSYRLLLDPRGAREPLRSAALHYRQLGAAFAHPLAVCAADTDAALEALEESDRALSPRDRAYVMLAIGWVDAATHGERDDARAALYAHLDLARPAAAFSVGRTRVPLEATVRVLEGADRVRHEGAEHVGSLAPAVHDFLLRSHEVTAAAMADAYHWRSLLSSVLPVEPEVAALSAIAMGAVEDREATDQLLGRVDLPPQALVPLAVGAAIVESTRPR